MERFVLEMRLLNVGALTEASELETIPESIDALLSAEAKLKKESSKKGKDESSKSSKGENHKHKDKEDSDDESSKNEILPPLTKEQGAALIQEKINRLWDIVHQREKEQVAGKPKKDAYLPVCGCPPEPNQSEKTQTLTMMKNKLIRKFFNNVPPACENCSAVPPKIRQLERCKIFRTRIIPVKGYEYDKLTLADDKDNEQDGDVSDSNNDESSSPSSDSDSSYHGDSAAENGEGGNKRRAKKAPPARSKKVQRQVV